MLPLGDSCPAEDQRSDPLLRDRVESMVVARFQTLRVGSHACGCPQPSHEPRLVVVTGGPGAGKTAVLELAARSFCEHVAVLPEAATIVFGGGFPRHDTTVGVRAAQKAIYAVQRQLEEVVLGERKVAVALCDRGTVDGVAYWPDLSESFWDATATTAEEELSRYDTVVHLRVPTGGLGYHTDPIRVETAEQAAAVDERIVEAWTRHPRRMELAAGADFSAKAKRALEVIRELLPPCCQQHSLATPDDHSTAT